MNDGETLFITFRLAGTLSAAAGRALQAERHASMQTAAAETDETISQAAHNRAQKVFFAKLDALLDAGSGPTWLDRETVAEIVAGEIMMQEEQGFQVLSFSVLPNHVHLLLHLPAGLGLSFYKALQLLQSRTASQCRRLVKLTSDDAFWQTGSYEYAVRDDAELQRITTYIQQNARRLGLPARWHEWPYCYVQC